MSFDEVVQVPEELRKQVSQRLRSTGVLKKITHSVKVGLTAAIGEIKGLRPDAKVPDVKSVLDHDGLRTVDPTEKLALQAVYQFLREHGLSYTLETLVEESTVDDRNSGIDLYKLFYVRDAELEIPAEDED
jgi:hypothetical protein